ncbi:hypothetical protein ACV337_26285 [Pseudomonas aeruginosa]|uniref:hypothetical protein n=1 Tax=Pseudomonas aeruginosa TaxID=287 RepID=UPI00249A5E5D|nr:hypothetical protein [Pseudomonas aeruginosa]EIU3709824.1 hypothetical protein [Pseudomonas aeruginosa]EIU3904007.1 hypothetical protein [Pseudomonas aeruginosa]EKV3211828.1 hypothetical protein [Pseudomonas aeruginosa]WGW23194.1 hypothetical protein P7I85_18650 [Pseudomonas aeruginosa]WGW84736.1 hypothetical protein QKA52_18640 [Pseudomonas aeruginosa]
MPKLLRGIEKNAETTGLQGQKSRVLTRTARSQKGFTAHITGEAICAVRMVLSQRPLLADSVEKVGLWESCFLAVQKNSILALLCETQDSSVFRLLSKPDFNVAPVREQNRGGTFQQDQSKAAVIWLKKHTLNHWSNRYRKAFPRSSWRLPVRRDIDKAPL